MDRKLNPALGAAAPVSAIAATSSVKMGSTFQQRHATEVAAAPLKRGTSKVSRSCPLMPDTAPNQIQTARGAGVAKTGKRRHWAEFVMPASANGISRLRKEVRLQAPSPARGEQREPVGR